ncbi:MAG: DUF5060 domain-containing protein [Pirellulaceae bacterium]
MSLMLLAWMTAVSVGSDPIVNDAVVFEEQDGVLAIEAEHFYKQTKTGKRAWYIHSSEKSVTRKPDGDPSHVAGASGGAYLEVLPDTRRNHGHKLIRGENFSNEPGKLAVLHYQAHFNEPGRYYVWVRAHSTGSEDNGIHVGIDGEWPDHGQRMQWCKGKQQWYWESKQRTEKEHCGVPYEIYIDVKEPGDHEIMFSLREDGFEFDKFLLTKQRELPRPSDIGPPSVVKSGEQPKSFTFVAATKTESKSEASAEPQADPNTARGADGIGSVEVVGELKTWHKVSLVLDGPFAMESDTEPNPFTDYALTATFQHETGKKFSVPGYFAADGDAANSSADAGTKWQVNFAPDRAGKWSYKLDLSKGEDVAIGGAGETLGDYSKSGDFSIEASDKTGRDFRAHGRLSYIGGHYLQFEGTEGYFLKAGPDAPETLLAYEEFDGTEGRKKGVPLKTWEPHLQDWRDGDPTWKDGKGKGLIGALNYLTEKGCNSFSFLPYNAGGDGDNIWPFRERDDKFHYDCSKLDQWGIVFDYGTSQGLYLHFKLQENELDDNRLGLGKKNAEVPESLDGGKLGRERKLYCRELIARFGHALALNWNIGEENTQTAEEQIAMIQYLHDVDPYDHNIVIHSYPDQQDKVYMPLLGANSMLSGASLQNSWATAHERTLKWRKLSAAEGRPWVVCNDEQNPASHGVPPDPGYADQDGVAENKDGSKYTLHDVRKKTLWGTLMAGGAGVEYYFGYKMAENDLVCQDFRSRDQSWDYCKIAIDFFQENDIPFWGMKPFDVLVEGDDCYCFAETGELYLVYMPNGGQASISVSEPEQYKLQWLNPRVGGDLTEGNLNATGTQLNFEAPDNEDWLAVIRK